MKNIAVIILAAGKGVRMKSATPKVMHPICGRPMLNYVLDLVKELKAKRVVAVVGHQHREVSRLFGRGIKVAVQKRLRGTADAVKVGLGALKNFSGTVLVLYADNPLLKIETIRNLLRYHRDNDLAATLLTATSDKPAGYGRILRDKYNSICGIIEEKDTDDFQKEIKEINTGIIAFAKDKLADALKYVRPNNRKREYYLTDTVGILYKKGALIDYVKLQDYKEALGINSRADLAQANKIMQARLNEDLMKNGVTLVDPNSAFIAYGAKIGTETVIYPFTVIENNVTIGKRCSIGPFAHLRDGTRLQDDIIIGNFVETVRTSIAPGTIAKHFCYLGDSRVGSKVNIGAGTVTANFDGRKKHITLIRDLAFIGSDTILVAPVKVGKGAKTGAGSVVCKNKNVADNSVVVGVPAKPLKTKRGK